MKVCSLSIAASIVATYAFAQQPVENIAESELPSLLAVYKDIHSHPELSAHEERTSAIIAKELRAAGCEVREHFGIYDKPNLKGYGVIGLMKNGEGPKVLVRTDMDALPVEEQTGLPYASKVTATDEEGKDVHVMHACGHDAHMAAFIGTVRALKRLKDQWHGTIMFVGQPAEETLNGARALLKGGLYDQFGKPDFALGYHDNSFLETGKIAVCEGYSYASADFVNITVQGVGGHGALPHTTKDPIVLSAEIINALQTIASRENNPLDPVVVTVGSIHGGTKHNIIPDEVKMQINVRTYKPDVRDRVLAAIDRIAKGIAIAAGIPAERAPIVEVLRDQFAPATYNNPDLTRRLVVVWKKALGADKVEKSDPMMVTEDFSEYSLPDHSIPACDFFIGAVDPAKIAESRKTGAPLPSVHSSKFAPVPEPTIRVGIIGMTSAVLELMKK
ncbi:MAG TPA: amidohydrolase [Candidatus Udaeobacter sp.]|nr:amidohydrolase [Candidatus Udaeobacter sp.]